MIVKTEMLVKTEMIVKAEIHSMMLTNDGRGRGVMWLMACSWYCQHMW